MAQKVYYADEFAADLARGGHNIVQTVYLECGMGYEETGPVPMRCVGETAFAQSQARPEVGMVDGIVGSANLQLGGEVVDAVLAAHLAASPHFKGVRTAFPDDLNEQWQDGYAALGRRGLSWEVAFGPNHQAMRTLAKLAAAHPAVTMVINHLGGHSGMIGGHPDDEFNGWKESRKPLRRLIQCVHSRGSRRRLSQPVCLCCAVAAIAGCPNVILKLGGTNQDHRRPALSPFHHTNRPTAGPMSSAELCDDLFCWYSHAIDTFGPCRCMFEANFPTDREGASYRTIWNLFKRVCARKGLSDEDKAQLFSGTARRVYRLPTPGGAGANL